MKILPNENNDMKTTAKDFFLWAAAMAALLVSVISLVALLFEYIDRLVGDTARYYDVYSTGITAAIASLIVIFPLYLWFTRMLNEDIRKHPEKKELWVRKWLVSLTIFVAGLAIVIDLITLLRYFLQGEELTAAFLLKVLTVLVIGGGVFYYYLSDIRGKWERNEKQSKMIAAIVAGLVLIAVVAGFFIIGSPATQRELRQDQQRVNDLQSLQYQIIEYWRTTESLPATLGDLSDPLKGYSIPTDPATGEAYEYSTTGATSFELCATFNLPSPETAQPSRVAYPGIYDTGNEFWQHDTGRTCFERTIDPELYPPYPER